jgi:hypothetical protein
VGKPAQADSMSNRLSKMATLELDKSLDEGLYKGER